MEGDRIDVAVEFTVQQLELVDRLTDEWSMSREVTVRRAVEDMIANLREGDGPELLARSVAVLGILTGRIVRQRSMVPGITNAASSRAGI
jgi:hypothetical protein